MTTKGNIEDMGIYFSVDIYKKVFTGFELALKKDIENDLKLYLEATYPTNKLFFFYEVFRNGDLFVVEVKKSENTEMLPVGYTEYEAVERLIRKIISSLSIFNLDNAEEKEVEGALRSSLPNFKERLYFDDVLIAKLSCGIAPSVPEAIALFQLISDGLNCRTSKRPELLGAIKDYQERNTSNYLTEIIRDAIEEIESQIEEGIMMDEFLQSF